MLLKTCKVLEYCPTMNTPKLYTVKEAAKIVGVSTNTLYKYLDEDRIHAARGSALQGRFRIPESALEEFLGVKLSTPEPVPSGSDLAGSAQPRDIPSGEGQTLQDEQTTVSPTPSHLPTRLIRLLLVVALLAMLVDLLIARSVTLPTQLVRICFVALIILMSYQEGGFRRE